MPEERIVRCKAATKSFLRSVENPMDLERLIWRGRGASRSLVKREWSLGDPGGTPPFRVEIKAVNEVCSGVEGYPRPCQSRTRGHRMATKEKPKEPTLYIEMGGPIALYMRGHPLPPSVQAGVIRCTDSGRGGVQIVESGGQRRQVGRLVVTLWASFALQCRRAGGSLGVVLLFVG
jgi:hypothetical protein